MSRGGINSNVDLKLTDRERAEAENAEYNQEVVDKQIATAKGYQNHGFLNPRTDNEGRPMATVTREQEKWSASDVRARRAEGKPVLPVFVLQDDNGEVTYVLTEADREAVMHGYICENCLGWQKSNIDINCETIRGFRCGYKRGM